MCSGSRFCVVIVTLLAGDAAGVMDYYRLGGTGGNGWGAALSVDPGKYLEVARDGQQRLVRISTPPRYATWQETLATFVDSVGGQWLRPLFVADTLNLALEGVRQRIPAGDRNLALSGMCAGYVDRLLPMFDGDPSTATFFRISTPEDAGMQRTLAQSVFVNLGADYPVERVRFFPRLGREMRETQKLVGAMRPPRLHLSDLGEADFSANRLPWFELSAAAAAADLPSDCSEEAPGRRWVREIPREVVNTTGDPRLSILARETNRKTPIVDISFPSRPLQWIGLRPLDALKDYEIAELQVYGHGYVPRTAYTTAILDLGEPMALGRIRWWGQRPTGTELKLRTRSGQDADPLQYWVTESTAEEFVEVSREAFLRAPVLARRTTENREHWSAWSPAYPWEDGLDASVGLTAPWQAGATILSPGPARYVQLQVVFESTPAVAARLRNLDVQLARPVARDVVAEVWPLEVERGVRTTFTYSLAADLVDGDAFDRLELFTLVRADTVRSVKVDAAEQGPEAARIAADGIVVHLPRLEGGRDTDKLVQIVFDARVVQFGTEFLAWVYDSGEEGARQRARAGDADDAYPGNALGVQTSRLGRSPLSSVQPQPNPFTPNGDGVHEVVRFVFDVYDVTAGRPLEVTIHDLSGRRVRQLERMQVRRGLYDDDPAAPTWDGNDDGGHRLPPGVYLYRVRFEGDGGEEVWIGTVALAY